MPEQPDIVLVLTNEAMPGFVRIEFAQENDLPKLIANINKAPLPLPYSVYVAARVLDRERMLRTLKLLFAEDYANSRDGFLKINVDLVRAVVEVAAITLLDFSDEELGISVEERAEADNARMLRQAHDPAIMRAMPEETLFFRFDEKITCTSTGSGKLSFENEELSPTEASLKALQTLGFDWTEIYEAGYWIRNIQTTKTKRGRAETGAKSERQHVKATAGRPADEDNPILFIKSG